MHSLCELSGRQFNAFDVSEPVWREYYSFTLIVVQYCIQSVRRGNVEIMNYTLSDTAATAFEHVCII